MNPFDTVRARIARSFLPDGYNIIKGEEPSLVGDGQLGEEEVAITKAEVMEQLDSITDEMQGIEELYKSEEEVSLKVGDRYKKLDVEYGDLYREYQKME